MNKLIVLVVAATCFMVSVCLAQEPPESAADRPGGVKSMEDRIRQIEDAIGRKVKSEKWYDRIQISGLVEVEAGYRDTDYDDPATEDESSSDVDLATVELVVDAAIVDHVDAHVMVKYEDDFQTTDTFTVQLAIEF